MNNTLFMILVMFGFLLVCLGMPLIISYHESISKWFKKYIFTKKLVLYRFYYNDGNVSKVVAEREWVKRTINDYKIIAKLMMHANTQKNCILDAVCISGKEVNIENSKTKTTSYYSGTW